MWGCSDGLSSGHLLAVLGEDGLMLLLKLECRRRLPDDTTTNDTDIAAPKAVEGKWHAEPVGFTRTSEPLRRLIWEQPLLLLGIAADAALHVLVGLQKVGLQAQQQQMSDSGDLSLKDGSKPVNHTGERYSHDALVASSQERESVDGSSDHSGEGSTQDGGSEAEETATGETDGRLLPKETQPAAKDPLDLTHLLFFRQGQDCSCTALLFPFWVWFLGRTSLSRCSPS